MKKLLSLRPVALLLEALRLYDRAGGAQTAAALSYYLILTLFPLLLCLNHLIGQFHVDLELLLAELEQFFPPQALLLLGEYLDFASRSRSLALFGLALFTLAASASAGLRTLFASMDRLFDRKTPNGLVRFALSLALSLLFLLTSYLSAAVVLLGEWFFRALEGLLPPALLARIPLALLASLWRWVRYLALFCLVLLLVLALFRLGVPRGAAPRRLVRLCALATAGVMVVASLVFSGFIGASTRYSLLYGSLASLVVLLVWLFFCGSILVLGAVAIRLFANKA